MLCGLLISTYHTLSLSLSPSTDSEVPVSMKANFTLLQRYTYHLCFNTLLHTLNRKLLSLSLSLFHVQRLVVVVVGRHGEHTESVSQ